MCEDGWVGMQRGGAAWGCSVGLEPNPRTPQETAEENQRLARPRTHMHQRLPCRHLPFRAHPGSWSRASAAGAQLEGGDLEADLSATRFDSRIDCRYERVGPRPQSVEHTVY